MNALAKKVVWSLLLLVCAGWAGGCQSSRSAGETDALFRQNRELQDELTRTRAALTAVESDRTALAGRIGDLESQVAAAQSRAAELPAPGGGDVGSFGGIEGIEAVNQGGQIKVRVPGDILFSSGKVAIKKSAEKTLDQIAKVIAQEYSGNTIRIEGYTDTDPIRKSKWKDNLELSIQRAAAVHRHLQKRGVEAERMEAVGLGQWHPSSSKAKSRRVEIVVVLDS